MTLVAKQQSRWFEYSLHMLGVVVIALTVGGYGILVYEPLTRRQEEASRRADLLEQLLLRQGAEGAEYRLLRSKLEETKTTIAELKSQLAEGQTVESLRADITAIAEQVDLKVLDYQLGPTQRFPTHSITEVEFFGNGSYASICQFLEQAEQLTKITKLSKFELASRENSLGYPIQLTFVLYSEAQSHDTRKE